MDSGCGDAPFGSSGRFVNVMENIGSEKRSYALNKSKAIVKKVQCSERRDIQIEETGGGIKIAFNTGTYELVKSVIQDFYANDCKQYTYSHIPVVDSRGNLVEIKYKIAKGKSQLYTLNMYNTKCSCLVNGKQPHQFTNIDLPNMLTKLQTQLQLCDKTVEDVNENIGRLLQKCQHDVNQSESVKYMNQKNDQEVEFKILERSLPEIQIPEPTTIKSSLPEIQLLEPETSNCDDHFADEFDHFISNDMLVKEAKVDMLIEKVQMLHTCVSSLKTELSAHIATTSNQFEIINDQLHSIRIQNKVNAKSSQDQVECIENTALEMNSKFQNQHESLFRKLQAIQDMIKMLNEKKQKVTEKENHQTEKSQKQPSTVIINQSEETPLKQINDTTTRVTTDVEELITCEPEVVNISTNLDFTSNHNYRVRPNDSTRNEDIVAAKTSRMISNTPKKTIIIGDSILKGIRRRGLKHNVEVCTLPGANTGTIASRLRNWEMDDFQTVIIYVGGNDKGSSMESQNNELRKCILSLKERYGNTLTIYLCKVCPRKDVDVSRVNRRIQQLGYVTSTEVIDVHGAFIYEDGYPVHGFFNYDGIHLNQRGSRSLVMAINNVAEIIKRRSVNSPRNEFNYSSRQFMRQPNLHATPLQNHGQTSPSPTHYNRRKNATRYESNMRTAHTGNRFGFFCTNCMMRNHNTRDCRRQNRSTGQRQTPSSNQYSGYEHYYERRQHNNTRYRHYTDVDNMREQ